MTDAQTFPSHIYNTPGNSAVLSKVFPYSADRYDLSAYERALPGLGSAIWTLIETERTELEIQAHLRGRRAGLPFIFANLFMPTAIFGPILVHQMMNTKKFDSYLNAPEEEKIHRHMQCATARAGIACPQIHARVMATANNTPGAAPHL